MLENLSSGFTTKEDSNQSAQLQRLVTVLKFACGKFINYTFKRMNNKGTDQIVWMHRLVCTFVFCMQQYQGLSHHSPYLSAIHLDRQAHCCYIFMPPIEALFCRLLRRILG